jgi:hypothetical protein
VFIFLSLFLSFPAAQNFPSGLLAFLFFSLFLFSSRRVVVYKTRRIMQRVISLSLSLSLDASASTSLSLVLSLSKDAREQKFAASWGRNKEKKSIST